MSSGWELELGVPGGAVSAGVVVVLAAGLIVLGWRETARGMGKARRSALLAGRVASAIAFVLLVSQPACVVDLVRAIPGRFVLAVDGSRSMGIRASGDSSRADEARRVAERIAGSPVRRKLASAVLVGHEVVPSKLSDLAARAHAKLDGTRLGAAIRDIGQRSRSSGDVGALLLVSDGAELDGWLRRGVDERARNELRALGARVHTVAVGGGAPIHDLAVVSVRGDRVGYLRTEARVEVTVRATGGLGGEVPVVLRQGENVLREQRVQLPDGGEATTTIPFVPARLGRMALTVSVPHRPEDVVPENDSRSFVVEVERDRLRVLLVCGRPSWDQRALRGLLERDPAVDLVSFFILRGHADLTMSSQDELALIPFPVDELFEEHLDSFDVVFLQDFDYGPYGMAPYLPRMRDYVLRGGSLVMVGGERSFTSGGYHGSPLADVLAVRLVPDGPESEILDPEPFVALPSPRALRHPLLALAADPASVRAAWARLAPVDGVNVVESLAEDALGLVLHPSRRLPDGGPHPLVAIREVGRGRSVAVTSDATYRWGMTTAGATGDASAYDRFWGQVLRWTSRDPELEPAQVTTDRERYGFGADVRAHGVLRQRDFEPHRDAPVVVSMSDTSGRRLVTRTVRTSAEGAFEAVVRAPEQSGAYVVRAESGDLFAEEVLVVEAGGEELADVRARPDLLRAIAEATGGTFATSAGALDLDALTASRTRVAGRERHRPFSGPWGLLLCVVTFGGEWILRRRWGFR
ncbi:MAG: hypothetical protein IT379_13730 [Deltaproteobacteria bacterium]|nr:hypothetical protein [Deltaproteobacteria bacterium]